MGIRRSRFKPLPMCRIKMWRTTSQVRRASGFRFLPDNMDGIHAIRSLARKHSGSFPNLYI